MTKRNFKLGDEVFFSHTNPSKYSIGFLLGEGAYITGDKFWVIGYCDSSLRPITYEELCSRTKQTGVKAENRINMLKFEELIGITSLASSADKFLSFASFKAKSLLTLKDNY